MMKVERCISRELRSNEGEGKYWARKLGRVEEREER